MLHVFEPLVTNWQHWLRGYGTFKSYSSAEQVCYHCHQEKDLRVWSPAPLNCSFSLLPVCDQPVSCSVHFLSCLRHHYDNSCSYSKAKINSSSFCHSIYHSNRKITKALYVQKYILNEAWYIHTRRYYKAIKINDYKTKSMCGSQRPKEQYQKVKLCIIRTQKRKKKTEHKKYVDKYYIP